MILILFLGFEQDYEKVTFNCGSTIIEIETPEIKKRDEYHFLEGKAEIYITVDNVVIELYCGGNYSPHISDKKRYKELSKSKGSIRGIDVETNTYWRKDRRLIYSNCKASDTVKYNKIFNDKIISVQN